MPTDAQIAGGHKANLNNPNVRVPMTIHQVWGNLMSGVDVPGVQGELEEDSR
jgi:hypothetical protein